MLNRLRIGLSVLILGCVLVPSGVQAGTDFLATGWNGDGSDYFRGSGQGVYLSGGASTVYRFRAIRTAKDRALPYSPLWQSFSFVVRDDRARHRVSFETSVRGSTDFYRGGFAGEVLYAFVEVVPEGRWAAMRAGRQLRMQGGAEGIVRFDGLSGRLELHHLLVEAYAGAELRTTRFVFPEPDADDELSAPKLPNDDYVFGVVFGTTGLRTTQLKVGFQDRIRAGKLARRTFSVDFHQRIAGRMSLRSNLAADMLLERLAEAVVGVDLRPHERVRVGVEYEHWRARFDATSIFSVFNTDPFDGLRAYGDVRIGSIGRLHASGGVQITPRAVTQDGVPREELGTVSGQQHFGVSFDLHRAVSVDFSERLLDGAGGQKVGLSLGAKIRAPGRVLALHLRGDVQRYAFDLQPGLEGWYGGASARVEIRPRDFLRASVQAEYIFSPWLTGNLQVAATLDFLFGGHIGKPGASGKLPLASVDQLQAGLLAQHIDPRTTPFAGLTGGVGLPGRTR